jgi:intein-encoded DNA endonuclease-like protein
MAQISEDKKQHIITLYTNQCTNDSINLAQISRESGVCRPTVRKILRQAGLRNVKKEDVDNSRFLNKEMFKAIDNEASAYFLGLMYADGNTYIRHNGIPTVSISLQERDKHILESFRDLVAPKHGLYFKQDKTQKRQNQFSLSFSNREIGQQLIKLGCIPAKSLKLTFPDFLPNNLLRHFIRGYFDGDGCLYSNAIKSDYTAYMFSLMSTKEFCQSVKGVFNSTPGVNSGIYTRKNGITSELSTGGNRQVHKLMKWLYKDANYFIQRKYDKFLELENIIKNGQPTY